MLWLCAFVCVAGCIALIVGPLESPKNGEPMPIWVFAIFAVIGTAATSYGVWLFRRGCIVLDARGIAWNLPLRKRFVAWEEINGLIVDRQLYLQVGARRISLAICGVHPTRLNLLLETIAQRAVNAGGAWESTGKIAQTEAAK